VRVLALSGKAAGALSALGARWGEWLAARRAESGEELAAVLADAAFTAGVGRNHFNHRAAIAFTGVDELAAGLAALAGADEAACAAGRVAGVVTGVRNPSAGASRIGFLFTGQGSQWVGMGQGLYASEPVFRMVLERCEAVVREVRGASLLDVMFGREEAAGSLDDTQWTQPGLYALQAGLVALWSSLGVKPVAVMGHSVGELAAAHAAGVYSLEDGLRLALARGALMGSLPAEGPEAGAMVAVFAPADRVAAVLRDYPDVSLAAENGAHRVVSGPVAAIEAVAGVFASEGVRCERLRTSHAFHSKLMDPILGALARVGDGLEVSAAEVPLVSNVTGRLVGAGDRLDGAYWRQHARSPVAFAQGVASLAGVGVDCLLEVGPHGVLSAMAGLCWPAGERPRLVVSQSRGEDATVSFARAVGTVYAVGAPLAFGGLFAGEARSRIALPGYPFQRQRYWLETKKARAVDQNAGFLLGPAVDVVANGQRIYPQRIGLGRQPWIGDHRVYEVAVLPGMSYVAMALQAVGVPARVEGVNFIEPLFVADDKSLEREAQLVVTPAAEGKAGQFQVLSRGTEAGDTWRQHAAGEIGAGAEFVSAARQVDLAAVQAQAPAMPLEELAALWAKIELRFGPCFAALRAAWVGPGVSLVRIAAPDALGSYAGAEPIHAVLLDACTRVTADVVRLAEEAESEGVFWAPWRIEAVSLSRPVPKEFYAYCDTESRVGADGLTRSTTILLLDADGQCFGEIAGFTVRRAPRAAFLRALQGVRPNVLYDIKWLTVANAPAQPAAAAAAAAAAADAGEGAIVVMAAQSSAFGTELAGVLQASGHAVIECLTADPAGSLAQMAADGRMAGVAGLVWLAAAGQQPAPDASSAAACALLQLMQEVQRQGRPLALGLSVVTHGGVAAGPGEACDPRASALWGMGRSLQNEAPDLHLRLLDAARAQPSLLAKIIIDKTSAPQLAIRANQILTPRLERSHHVAWGEHGLSVSGRGEDSSYLITGGLGALGLEAASWLAEQGARHVVLVSRRLPDAATAARLQGLEAATGCRLVMQSLDISDGPAVAALVARFCAAEGGWPRLAGVVHAAGVLDDGVIADQTPERLAGVWNPKALGAWNLHEATRGHDLDLFVLYSSVAAVLGSPGQSNYAAANGFLDGLAALRRSQGLVATSVAWGPWSRGMADDERVRSKLLRQGLRPLEPEDAHVAMQRLLRLGTAGGVVLDADFVRMGELMGDRRSPLLSGLIVPQGATVNSDLLRRIKEAKPDERQGLIVTFLQGELQAVLGLASPPDPMTGFFDLGMDSLMALEFGTRLANAFGNEVALPPTLAFDYPSLDKLAGYLTDNLSPDRNTAAKASGKNMLAEKSLEELMSELSSRL
jgi:acyl transferase domain-containing protein/acyl carrier protein